MASMRFILFQYLLLICLCSGLACEAETVYDRYLCRNCGSSLRDSNTFADALSPYTITQKNITLNSPTSTKQITIQKLKNPAGIIFDVITVKSSSCLAAGKWIADSTWFPGFSWKACVCSQCGSHLGWMFELDSVVNGSKPIKPTATGFYAIVFQSVLEESVAQKLTLTIFRQ